MTLQAAVDQMTPEKLIDWLEGLDPKRRLECGSARRCLFAEYLNSLTCSKVWVLRATACDDSQSARLPDWAVSVRRSFDEAGPFGASRPPSVCIHIVRRVCGVKA